MHWRIDVVCSDDGVLVLDHSDPSLVHDALGELQLLSQRLDDSARLASIPNVFVAFNAPVPERELHETARDTALVHSLIGVLTDLHDDSSSNIRRRGRGRAACGVIASPRSRKT